MTLFDTIFFNLKISATTHIIRRHIHQKISRKSQRNENLNFTPKFKRKSNFNLECYLN